FKGLPGMVADSLPDDYGNRIIDEWIVSKGLGVDTISPVDRLCYVGKRGMGALEYEPADHEKLLDESSIIDISHLTELAREALNERETFRASLLSTDTAIKDILKV